jgi:hypothetical protein
MIITSSSGAPMGSQEVARAPRPAMLQRPDRYQIATRISSLIACLLHIFAAGIIRTNKAM